jgi:hypothetical protein
MNINQRISTFLFCLLFIISPRLSSSQDISGLDNLIPNNSGKIDNALKDISEAGHLTQEANNYYNDALALQSNNELDEKTLQKKLAKTEDKAVALQLKADKLYAQAYKSLYELCLNSLKASTVSYGETGSYEASAADMVSNAAAKRKEASDTKDPYKKAELLNDAAGLDAAAIENLIFALQVQNGITPKSAIQPEETEEPAVQPSNTVPEKKYAQPGRTQGSLSSGAVERKSENLSVNQGIIEKYNDYVNDTSIPEPITINRSGVSGVRYVSMDSAISIFYAMHTGNTLIYTPAITPDEEEQQAVIADSVGYLARTSAETTTTGEKITESENITGTEGNKVSNTVSQTKTGKKETTQHEQPEVSQKKRESVDISYSHQSTGVRFFVQIAASHAPLTRTQLWAIYPGNLSVEVVKEDSWYKYRITNFRVFSNANRVALESGVRSAFVLATEGDNRINLVDARDMTRVLESDLSRYGSTVINNGVDFYVQVAASRIRLSDDERSLYCGSANTCREIIEEGWFKYQIYAGTDYNQAVELRNRITGKSFIVAYENGTRVSLYRAMNK